MRIEINSFGTIKRFDFNSDNDFIIIYGKNNTGKSYAITVVYLVLKHFSDDFYFMARKRSIFNRGFFAIENIGYKDVEQNIKKQLEKMFSGIVKNISNSFENTFNSLETLQNKFNNEQMSIKIYFEDLSLKIIEENNKLVISEFILHKKARAKATIRRLHFKETNTEYSIYYKDDDGGELIRENLIECIQSIYGKCIREIRSQIGDMHYLPASRSGLYQAMSSFGQIMAELAKHRHLFRSAIEIPAISEPLSDYYLSISSIRARKDESALSQIAQKIENSILNGDVSFNDKTKKIEFTPFETGLTLDLSYTSSMVSEISPIVSYLKHIVRADDSAKTLLIIEEPEAHLHPSIQIKLMGIFAELSNNNVKIIMTTHSNYMFNKFNNLILANKINKETATAMIFEFSEHGSIANNVSLSQFGAKDSNFAETSEEIYNEKIELVNALNTTQG